jgi:hypothetical protein
MGVACAARLDAHQVPSEFYGLTAIRLSTLVTPRRQPSGMFGFFAFRPGSHRTLKHDLAAMCLDRDTVRVNQRAAPERLLDLLPDCEAAPKRDPSQNCRKHLKSPEKTPDVRGPDRRRSGPHRATILNGSS